MNQKKEDFNRQFNDWVSKEKTAVSLLNVVGTLMYDKGIELVLFRRHLLDSNVSQLLNLFSYANNVIDRETDLETALLLSKEILNLNLPPSKLDKLRSSFDRRSAVSTSVSLSITFFA